MVARGRLSFLPADVDALCVCRWHRRARRPGLEALNANRYTPCMNLPAPFDDAFLADCPYDPEVLLVDELLEVDREKSLVRCAWHTHPDMPITRSQRSHPVRHPSHVAGALMVQASGMLGFVHAYHILDVRHADGWVGFGTHMHDVKFSKLVAPGEVIDCRCQAIRLRIGKLRHFIRYAFEFRVDNDLCYKSEQSAMWNKVA